MQVIATDKGPYTLLTVSGRLDASTSPAFDESAKALGPDFGKHVILDLSGLDFVSSSGLRSFLSLAKSLRKAGFEAAFCSLPPMAAEVFKIAGFTSILKVLPDEAAAAAALAEA
jgi:anti-anti-sigma factor